MKPMMIIGPGLMSESDIGLLRENGICVVVSEKPAELKFVDPLPVVASRTEIERAAIGLSRILLNGQWGRWSNFQEIGQGTFAKIFVDLLSKGTPIDAAGSREEQETQCYNDAWREEIARLAKEDARAAHKARKEVAAKEAKEAK